MNKNLNFVIERKLKFNVSGKTVSGNLRIGGIKKYGKAFGCYCFVSHLTRGGKWIYGVDPLQALSLGLKYVQFELESAPAQGIEVWCYKRGDKGEF